MTKANPNSAKDRNPIPTVDLVLRKQPDLILLERRACQPFAGLLALPGGHVDYGETVEFAILRELREECSLDARLVTILGVYSDPSRDPRGHRISTVFIGEWISGEPTAGDDAAAVFWAKLDQIGNLNEGNRFAFDHARIIEDYEKWLKGPGGSNSFWSSKAS